MSNQVYSNDVSTYQGQFKADTIAIGGPFVALINAAVQYSVLPTMVQLILPPIAVAATINATFITFTLPAAVPKPTRFLTQPCVIVQNNIILVGKIEISQAGAVLISTTTSFLIGQTTGLVQQLVSIYLL